MVEKSSGVGSWESGVEKETTPWSEAIPRIIIAGTHSGVGKTTVSSGLMAALHAKGHRVAPFKVGPDFIDPSYHALATGRPGRNLDAFLSGPELIGPLFAHGARGADIAIVEGGDHIR